MAALHKGSAEVAIFLYACQDGVPHRPPCYRRGHLAGSWVDICFLNQFLISDIIIEHCKLISPLQQCLSPLCPASHSVGQESSFILQNVVSLPIRSSCQCCCEICVQFEVLQIFWRDLGEILQQCVVVVEETVVFP